MKKLFLSFLKNFAKPFIGKGVIDKNAHFIIPIFEFLYSRLQKKKKITTGIPLNMKMKVFSNDPGIGLNLVLGKSFEPTTTKLFLSIIKPKDTVLDIGANYGYYTLLASRLAGKEGKVFSFEPDSENADLLKENVKLNGCKNVKITKKAVSDKNGAIFFKSEKFNKGESSISREDREIKVAGVTLDSYFSKYNYKADVIIIDVEGSEIRALKGAEKLISKSKNLILFIEYNPSRLEYYGYSPESLIKILKAFGFRSILIVDDSKDKTIRASSKNLDLVLKHKTYCNLVCAKV